jgi:hypothetical protein
MFEANHASKLQCEEINSLYSTLEAASQGIPESGLFREMVVIMAWARLPE